ncbi:MAG: twin-arginine translocase TatA/TatE family subunit [Deltaproteobacteria bacterium]|jgi:sec-independent protein translocase protein TatB|nr:twin-arginine translocase TatA/TatE family subunit [Deltaproteobacteria bacterium]
MFGLSMGELAVIAVVALVLLGPDKLPKVMRFLARGYAYLTRMKMELNRAFEENVGSLDPRLWEKDLTKLAPELSDLKKDLKALEQEAGLAATTEQLKKENPAEPDSEPFGPVKAVSAEPVGLIKTSEPIDLVKTAEPVGLVKTAESVIPVKAAGAVGAALTSSVPSSPDSSDESAGSAKDVENVNKI